MMSPPASNPKSSRGRWATKNATIWVELQIIDRCNEFVGLQQPHDTCALLTIDENGKKRNVYNVALLAKLSAVEVVDVTGDKVNAAIKTRLDFLNALIHHGVAAIPFRPEMYGDNRVCVSNCEN